jgi:TrmH family RNA methyltransferase
MGSIFNMPLCLGVEERDVVDFAAQKGLEIVCADPAGGVDVWEVDLSGSPVLVLGSEREGIPVDLLEASRTKIRIPQEPGMDSVNVGAAGSTILYEALRQRRKTVYS